jgi:bifunctional enzyme Fae/Hps
VAHIDLIIGEKDGPVGQAFASALSKPSVGHTPLLAVLRPNLPCKPFTIVVPKVTVQNMEQAGRIFGPAQAAVAKAVADAVEEGTIPRDLVEKLVIICGVFVHPKAKDSRRIYHYNYGATKLAIKRAMEGYPPLEKILYEKERAKHPLVDFRAPRLWMPPYLQVALDLTDLEAVKRVVSQIPKSDRVILEVGTPLLKKYGVRVIRDLREIAKDAFIIADLKTLDVGQVEVDIAYEETADAVVVSGLAPIETIRRFVHEAKRLGIYAYVDMMGVKDPLEVLNSLEELPEVVILHRGIDEEGVGRIGWDIIGKVKEAFKEKKILVAVAGGITPETADKALQSGADILIVGRSITQSKDVERACRDFLRILGPDADVYRIHVE